MPQRTKVTGTRSFTLWLLIFIAVVLVAGVAAGALFLLPQIQSQQDLEKHYQAGVAFQDVGDWAAAEGEFKQVISAEASYKDVQARLAEMRTRLAEGQATATAAAVAQAEQARANAQAMATAQAQATVEAQANSKATATAQAEQAQAEAQATATAQAQATARAQANAQATAAAAPTATAEALEAHYQKGLGYINMGRWEQAKAELEQVFEVDPNYQEVQAKLAEVEAEMAKLTPTATPTPIVTPTPTPTATPEITMVYSNHFEGAVGSEWSNTARSTTPSGRGFLGEFGNGTVSLTLKGLPSHTEAVVSFDLFIIRSWDGSQEVEPGTGTAVGPDEWDLNVAYGPTLLHTTFSHISTYPQAYPDGYPGGNNPPGVGAAERNSLGYSFSHPTAGGPMDSVYQLSFTFPHSAASLVLNFSASGLQKLADESWGIDNVEVLVTEISKSP